MDTIISPTQLWKDYDPDELLLDISIARESDCGDFMSRMFYYTALNGLDGKIRAFAEFLYPKVPDPVPVITVLCDDDNIGREYAMRVIRSGYGALVINTNGDNSRPRCTMYPNSLNVGVYENAKNVLYTVAQREQDTPWYIWAVIARRGVSALAKFCECDENNIGVAGIRTGADLAVMLAAVDDRVKAVLVMRQAGGDKPLPIEEDSRSQVGFDRYLIALSNAAYIKLVKKPMLMLAGANDPCNNLEYLSDLAAVVSPAVYMSLLISADRCCQISAEYGDADIRFFDSFLRGGETPPERPRMELVAEDDEIAVKIIPDKADGIEKVSLFISRADVVSQFRFWEPLEVTEQEDGYCAAAPYIADCVHILYAKAVYKNGITLTSLAYRIKPRNKVPEGKETRLLYSDRDGIGCFCSNNTGKLFAPVDGIEFVEGVMGLWGVRATDGKLCTCIISDARRRGYDGDGLQVMFCTSTEQKLVIKVYKCTAGEVIMYRNTVQISAGRIWQKLSLSPGDFRNAENVQLSSFYDVCRLMFSAQDPDFIINNLIWI